MQARQGGGENGGNGGKPQEAEGRRKWVWWTHRGLVSSTGVFVNVRSGTDPAFISGREV